MSTTQKPGNATSTLQTRCTPRCHTSLLPVSVVNSEFQDSVAHAQNHTTAHMRHGAISCVGSHQFWLYFASVKSGWDCVWQLPELRCSLVWITPSAGGMRMARRKCGLPLGGEHVLLCPTCSSILFLLRHILLSEACANCDCGLRCKCDGNIGKDVRPVSAHINWGEPGRYLDALSGKDCQGNGKGISFMTSLSMLAIGWREPRYGQMKKRTWK